MSMLELLAAIMTALTFGLFAYTIYHEKWKRRFVYAVTNGCEILLPLFPK